MAQKIVAGNWKMNLLSEEAFSLVNELNEQLGESDVRVALFPPSLYVMPIARMNQGKFQVGVQNFYSEASGAYTGELAVDQIKSVGGSIGLIGHSERREYFGEDDATLKAKVDFAVAHDFEFIFCCGEPLEVREEGNEFSFVEAQLEASLFHLDASQMKGRIIAYEPIWAIGTGRTASAAQAEDMHREIRSWLSSRYGNEVANEVSILYGGSCKPSNAQELFACPNIDGGLIGGASLKAEDFCAIIDAY